jgi:hypothetical protein
MRHAALGFFVVVLLALAPAATGSDRAGGGGAVGSPGRPSKTFVPAPGEATPRAFADATQAQLASDGELGLWLLETGYRRGRLRLALYERESGRWGRMEGPPQRPSGAGVVKVAPAPGTIMPQPCLGFTEAGTGRPLVTCHGLRKWFPWSFEHLVPAGSRLVDLATIRGRLTALFAYRDPRGRHTLAVIRSNPGGGHFDRTGQPLRVGRALAQLGDGTHERGDPAVEIALETQGPRPSRYVERLDRDHWVRVGPVLRGPGLGPLVSGSVRVGERTYMPANDAETSPWDFSAYVSAGGSRWARSGSGPLSTGLGNAQGRLDFAAGAAWASWQEDRALSSGGFAATIRIARLGPSGEPLEEQKLWQGRVVGPGSTQVIAFEGKLLALYMRGGRQGRLVPTVVPITEESTAGGA